MASPSTDKQPPNFLSLPAELRTTIYTHALQPAPSARINPQLDPHTWHQPPITRVSRIVRQESLPIFYQTNRFTLRFMFFDCNYSSVAHAPACPECRARPADWVRAVGHRNLQHVRRLGVSSMGAHPEMGWCMYFLTLVQCQRRRLLAVDESEMCHISPSGGLREQRLEALNAVLADFMEREWEPGLSPEVIEAVVRFLCQK